MVVRREAGLRYWLFSFVIYFNFLFAWFFVSFISIALIIFFAFVVLFAFFALFALFVFVGIAARGSWFGEIRGNV